MKGIEFNLSTYQLTQQVNSLVKIKDQLGPFMKKELYKLQKHVRTSYVESGLKVRTGNLIRSIVPGAVVERAQGVGGTLLVGQGLNYAKIQEFGGTIQPINAQWLTIPVGPMLTKAGVFKYANVRDAGKEWDLRFLVGPRIVLGHKKGSSEPWQLVFVLRKKVTIPARHFLRDGLAKFKPVFAKDVDILLTRTWRAAGKKAGEA